MRATRLLPPAMLAAALATAAPAAAADVDVIARGLDNPRHVAVDARGDVYVAEAGRGGPAGPGASCFDSPEGSACVGATGAITRIADADGRRPWASRVLSGLASFAAAGGRAANGPHGIDAHGGQVYFTNGGPTAPRRGGQVISRDVLAAENAVAAGFGTVQRLKRRGGAEVLADPWAFERDNNPDVTAGSPLVDSNPVGVAVDRGRLLIADAGGNTVLRVNRRGRIDVLALFANRPTPSPFGGPDIPMNAVPTSVVADGHGGYYVSQLTGFPFPVGGSWIWHVDRRGGEPVPALDGFTNVMDLAVGRDGTLYVLELDHNSLLRPGTEGALFAVSPWGGAPQRIDAPGSLTAPGGVDVGRHGELYVSNRSTEAGAGEVLRIRR